MNKPASGLANTRQSSFRKTEKFIIKNAPLPTTTTKKLSVGPYPPTLKDPLRNKLEIRQQSSNEAPSQFQINTGFSYDKFKKATPKETFEVKKPQSRTDLGFDDHFSKPDLNMDEYVKKAKLDEANKKLEIVTRKYEELKLQAKTLETSFKTSVKKSENLAKENRTLRERIRQLEERNKQLNERNNERISYPHQDDNFEEAKIDMDELRSLQLAMNLQTENILMNRLSQIAALQMMCQPPERNVNLDDPTTINPDNMTYEELIQLGEKIGNVSRGLDVQDIKKIPKRAVTLRNKPEEPCSICFCEVDIGSKVRTLPCSHAYHSKCIKQWLVNEKTCPICKDEVRIS